MKKWLACIMLLLSTQWVHALATDELVSRLTQIQTLKASFVQRVMTAKGQVKQSSRGTLLLSRPGRFRWTVTAPSKQILVADGRRLWVYDVDLEQVSVQRQSAAIKGRPALLLSGRAQNIVRDYKVKRLKSKAGIYKYLLESKSVGEDFGQVLFVFRNEMLSEMRFNDNLGHTVVLDFFNQNVNTVIPPKLLRFRPPSGVDVVEQAAP